MILRCRTGPEDAWSDWPAPIASRRLWEGWSWNLLSEAGWWNLLSKVGWLQEPWKRLYPKKNGQVKVSRARLGENRAPGRCLHVVKLVAAGSGAFEAAEPVPRLAFGE